MSTLDKLQKAFPESYRKGNVLLINADCMDVMKLLDDKEFCLACVDPPYGIGENGDRNKSRSKLATSKDYKAFAGNDISAPEKTYFDELLRISKNQIVWGANHFISRLPIDSSCWLVWDKDNGMNDFADCELAWSSFNSAVRKFKYTWHGMRQENMKNKETRIHPTQKPVKLYEWLLTNYAKKGQRVFDSHLGSGSSAIAAHYFGVDFVGCELDKDYFDAAKARFDMATKQQAMEF